MNKLFYGDNLDVLRKFVCDENVDLCSIRPLMSEHNVNQTDIRNGRLKPALENKCWLILAERVFRIKYH